MKLLLTVILLTTGICQAANQSSKDIVTILNDKIITRTIDNAEISNISNLGRRTYEISFGNCVLRTSVVSTCSGSMCVSQVQFSSGNVNCL
jgi:hypothetical protein